MKEIWLEKRPFSNVYIYWEGLEEHKHRNIISLKSEGLIRRLDDIIDHKRKSLFHLRGIPEEIREDFKERYKNTKIKIVYED